jgi:hypothetical protein
MMENMQNLSMPVSPYARGGKVKSRRKGGGKGILVHMNKKEIRELSRLQGGEDRDENGIPHFTNLDSVTQNPHILSAIAHHAAEHHAHGGGVGDNYSPSYSKIAHLGEHGDTELAYITPHVKHVFDHMIGGPSRNPHDGRPQYFLGSLMGGLSKAIAPALGSIGRSVMPALSGMAGKAASSLGGLARSAMPAIQSGLSGALKSATSVNPETGMSPLFSGAMSLGQGLMSGQGFGKSLAGAANSATQGINDPVANAIRGASGSYMQGNSMRDAAMHGVNAGTEGMENNPLARAARGFAGSQLRGEDLRSSFGNSYMQGTEGMDDNPMIAASRGAVDQGMRGGNMRDMLAAGAMAGAGNRNDPLSHMARGMGQGHFAGEGLEGGLQRGMMNVTEGRDDPYSQGMRGMIESRRGGGNYMDSMRQGAMRGMQSMRPQPQLQQRPQYDDYGQDDYGYGDEQQYSQPMRQQQQQPQQRMAQRYNPQDDYGYDDEDQYGYGY